MGRPQPVCGAVIWGVQFCVVKQTLSELPRALPRCVSPGRFAPSRHPEVMGQNLHLKRDESGKCYCWGVAGIAGTQAFYTLGIARTSASNSSVIMATTPVFVALLGALFHVERITPIMWLGIAFSVGEQRCWSVRLGRGFVRHSGVRRQPCWFCWEPSVGHLHTRSYTIAGHYSPIKIFTLVTITAGSSVGVAAGEVTYMQWTQFLQGGGTLLFFCLAAPWSSIWIQAFRRSGNARTAVFMNVPDPSQRDRQLVVMGEVLEPGKSSGSHYSVRGYAQRVLRTAI